MKKIFTAILLCIGIFLSQSQCLEVTSILVDACAPGTTGCSNAASPACNCEGKNEMISFTVGATPLDIADITPDWPNNTFQGWCQNTTTQALTTTLNNSIISTCGLLLEPPAGLIPANAKVIIVTSTDMCTTANTFEGLTETVYMIYQCPGNYQGHFANGSGTGTRNLIMNVAGPCVQSELVTYDRGLLTNVDGARVLFDAIGNATYVDTLGCTAPITAYSPNWFIEDVCITAGIIDLNTLLSSNATTGGSWSGNGVIGNNFDPTSVPLGSNNITYTVNPPGCPASPVDSTITFNVLNQPAPGQITIQGCDSIFYNSTWYFASTSFNENYPATTSFECDSSALINLIVSDAIRDTIYLANCDSVSFQGNWYLNDTSFVDTITGSTGTVTTACLEEDFNSGTDYTDIGWQQNSAYINGGNSVSGNKVGMNATNDWIMTPLLTDPEDLSFSIRTSSDPDNWTLTVETSPTGAAPWTVQSSVVENGAGGIVSNTYTQINVPLNLIGDYYIRFFLTRTTGSCYMDDVNVTCGGGITPQCDSIKTTFIQIYDQVYTYEYLTTTNPSLAGSISTTFPNASTQGCDSSHTIVTTFVQNCNLDTTSIMSYNALQYSASPTVNRDAEFIAIISEVSPDILVLQEINNLAGANAFRDNVMAAVSSDYLMATFIESNNMDNVLFYKQSKFSLTNTSSIANSGPRDFHEFEMMHRASCTPFNIYSVHFKAGTSVSDQNIRATQANELRAVTNILPPATNFLMVGDFNIYSSLDDSYINLINDTGNDGEAIDPLSLIGTWNNPTYANFHTQSPRTTSFNGGANGGLDDRLDIIFHSPAIFNGSTNMYHIASEYQAYGNDGQHYNIALTDAPANSVVSPAISQALHDASDHLPVITSFAFCITIDTTFLNDTICFGSTYTLPSGTIATATGIYQDTGSTVLGCDSIVQLDLVVLNEKSVTLDTIICFGEAIVINGNTYDSSVIGATETITNIGNQNCDSTITINLTVLALDSTFEINTSCNPMDTGTNTNTFTNMNNCDSLHTIITSLLPSDSTTSNITSCLPADVGTVSSTLVNSSNCDSVHTVITTLAPFSSATENLTACDSIEVLTDWYFSSTSFSDTLINGAANNCDSITIFNITINSSSTGTFDTTICNGSSFVFNGTTYNNSNLTGTETLTASNNCDSIVTVTITELALITGTFDTTICNGASFIYNGTTYDNANLTGNETFTSSFGCDSIVTVTVTESTQITGTFDTTICNGASFIFNGTTYSNMNLTGSETLTAANGCDSVVTVTVTELAPITGTLDSTICNGASFVFNGTTYDNSNLNGTETLIAANGCDSIVTVTVTELALISVPFDTAICNGASFVFNGTTYDNSNLTGTEIFTAANTCDSIVTVTVTELALISEPFDTTICNGASFVFNGTTYDNSNLSGTETFTSAYGCDSIVVVTVTELAPINEPFDTTICNGASFIFNGTTYDATNLTGTETFTSALGCDSNVLVTVTELAPITALFDTFICNGGSIVLNGTTYDASNLTGTETYSSALTCDSVVTITVTELPLNEVTIPITACDSVEILSTWYFASTMVNAVSTDQNSCDSTTVFDITINNSITTTSASTSCLPADTGVFVSNLATALGCDSTHIETITLLPSATATVIVNACDSILIEGVMQYASSTFDFVSSNGAANGCDSITTYVLTINQTLITNENLTTCDSFTLDNTTYTSSQIVTITYLSNANCDSIYNLDLTIINGSDSILNLTICPYEFPLTLADGSTISNEVSSYDVTVENNVGCDSIITYNISASQDYSVSPSYIQANSGDSVAFVIENENINSSFSYSSSNGDDCPDNCQNYYVYPQETSNFYYFTIIDTASGCIFGDTLQVDIDYYSELNVPNIFTPNGDGQNDIYRTYGKDIVQYKLEIFDRWGGRMYYTETLTEGWDGIFNSLPVESGIYIVIIRATGQDGQKYEITQNIKLVR